MGKRTIGWDLSFEKMTVSNNILRGDVTLFLLLKGGDYHRCQFHTSYKTEEPVTLPQNHVVEHSIMRTDLDDKDGKKVQLEEIAVAHVNPL
ncbi:GFP-like fluorescent chromoprotein amFP486 [Pocillopora damicornis]|nr:GFP-like fluorescent chromoprotein amFP486 [Pocillopora damicornis]